MTLIRIMSFKEGFKAGLNWAVRLFGSLIVIGAGSTLAFAGGVQTMHPVEVTDSAEDLVGAADSSTEGTILSQQLEERPYSRTGEVLESIPGMEISQHSGEGKANQYYLRGFNLDHGTDFQTTVCGAPVNMPSHAHGQGYSDLNFMIPEIVSGIQYHKGSYFAEQGDFSAAGSANIMCANVLEHSIAKVEEGTDGFQRYLLASSPAFLGGHLLYALEMSHSDGPWVHPDNYNKYNGLVRYSRTMGENQYSLTFQGYHGEWNSTDQVALRAIGEGLIPLFGSLDPTDGGHSYRYGTTGEWQRTSGEVTTKADAYIISYGLDLWSDFTYFLSNPEPPLGNGTGDQFEQADRRVVTGLAASQNWSNQVAGRPMENTIGVQIRHDNIDVGLFHTQDRVILNTFSQDHVNQTSEAFYLENRYRWAEKVRTIAGWRVDFYQWSVTSNDPLNNGTVAKSLGSPKLSMILGPWAKTEFYINAGDGFHSNDGRGTTEREAINQITKQLTPQEKVNGLVRSEGAEIGVRTAIVPHLQSELTLWVLNLNSELTLDADIAQSTPGPPSHRRGVEWANFYTPVSWLTVDADYAYSFARYRDATEGPYFFAGNRIAEAPSSVISAGAFIGDWNGLTGGLRLRYFGRRPLVEDDSIASSPSTILNGRIGYRFLKNWEVDLDVFNLLNGREMDVEYVYASRLPGEPLQGVQDIHIHPEAPRETRVTLTYRF